MTWLQHPGSTYHTTQGIHSTRVLWPLNWVEALNRGLRFNVALPRAQREPAQHRLRNRSSSSGVGSIGDDCNRKHSNRRSGQRSTGAVAGRGFERRAIDGRGGGCWARVSCDAGFCHVPAAQPHRRARQGTVADSGRTVRARRANPSSGGRRRAVGGRGGGC